jgi:hypothetical protein
VLSKRKKKLLSLSLLATVTGIISGCAAIGTPFLGEMATYAVGAAVESSKTRQNYYEPEILTSRQDMIRIQYLGTGPHTRHEEVIQTMSDHCDGSYVETYRVHEIGYTTVEAECTGSTDPSPELGLIKNE